MITKITQRNLLFAFIIASSFLFTNEVKAQKNQVLTFAEQMPEFPGGTEAMYTFLSKNVAYPEKLRAMGIEGKVVLTFVVTKKGKIKKIEVHGKPEPLFAKEAVRVIKKMPKWTPGQQNKKPVNVKFTLPIRFQLN
jgi:protein TonB